MKLNTDNNNRILIRNGTVWDGSALYKSDILICGGIISKISKSIDESADFCLNAENMIVSAGLTDFHTHIKGISPEHIGIDYEKISYPFGVTHLVDASAEIGDINNILNSNIDISVLARVHIFGNKADFSLTEEILEKYSHKVIGLKVYLDINFTEVADARPLAEICKYARKRNLFVTVHTTNSPISMLEIVNTLSKGDIISHAFHGGKNNAAENDFIALKTAKAKGVLLDGAFSVGYHIDYSIFKAAVSKGFLPDIISTDITKEQEYIGNERYGLTVCMSIAEKLGMTLQEVLTAVTCNPARLIKNPNNQGYLKIGEKAEIAVIKREAKNLEISDTQNNNISINNAFNCVLTVNGNKVRYIDKELCS